MHSVFQVVAIIASYLIGAIPTAYIVVRMIDGSDIREQGSGNVGATNVLRILGKPWFAVTLVCDIAKGYLPVLLVVQLFPSQELLQSLCVVAVISGHTWPVFLKFKGGKGVATSTGAFFALAPGVMLGTALVWFIMIFLTKIVSVSSIAGGLTFIVLVFVLKEPLVVKIFGSILAILVIYKHKENIKRIIKGKEPRIGK